MHELIHMKETWVVAEQSVPGMPSEKNAVRVQNRSERKFCGGVFHLSQRGGQASENSLK